jgi:hypothetical protein
VCTHIEEVYDFNNDRYLKMRTFGLGREEQKQGKRNKASNNIE